MTDIFDQAAGDIFDQAAVMPASSGVPAIIRNAAQPAGYVPPLIKNASGKLAGAPSALITSAPEESGLTTGPLMSPHPEENNWTFSGGDPLARRSVARAANAAKETIEGFIPATYHAFADAPTAEETQAYGGPQEVSGLTRIIHDFEDKRSLLCYKQVD